MKRFLFFLLIAFFGACPGLLSAQAQSNGFAYPVAIDMADADTRHHSALKATLLSLGLPGAGQVYNRKIWKVPIIYAGLGATGYAIYFNNREYQRYRTAYLARVSTDTPELVEDEFTGTGFTPPVLREFRNFYRSNLELSVLGFSLVYILNGVDAFVDAHLFYFDVSDDLGIKGNFGPSSDGTGISMVIGWQTKQVNPASPF